MEEVMCCSLLILCGILVCVLLPRTPGATYPSSMASSQVDEGSYVLQSLYSVWHPGVCFTPLVSRSYLPVFHGLLSRRPSGLPPACPLCPVDGASSSLFTLDWRRWLGLKPRSLGKF